MTRIEAKEMRLNDRPLSELLRITGKQWAEYEAAYTAMKEAKATTLARLKQQKMDEASNRKFKLSEAAADREARNDPYWQDYLDLMAKNNARRLDLKIEVDCIHMANSERIDKNANARKEIASYGA